MNRVHNFQPGDIVEAIYEKDSLHYVVLELAGPYGVMVKSLTSGESHVLMNCLEFKASKARPNSTLASIDE